MFTLRKYQQDAVDAVIADIDKPGNSLVVLPTGSGKSHVISEVANEVNKPILILQPSREILTQNLAKLAIYVPSHNVGVYSASFGKRQIRKFTFATIQSIYKKPHLFTQFGLVLLDECDLLNVKNQNSMFTSFLKGMGAEKVIGLTATPYRNMIGYHKDSAGNLFSALTLKLINRIKPDFWKRIIYNINNQELFDQEDLCPIRYFDRSMFDHKEIPMNKSRSDFDTDKFAQKLAVQRPTILDLVQRAANKMQSVLVFCNSVAEAKGYAAQTPNSASVDGKTPKRERDRIIRAFKDGRIKVVFNVNCLSVGFDHPGLDCIFTLRPTRSLRLWYQQLGRGIRISPETGKEYCVVVDFTSNLVNLGRIETIKLIQEKRMFDVRPMWYLVTDAEQNWHGKQLYEFNVSAMNKYGRVTI